MEDVALLTDSDKQEDDVNHISLMTIHQSKGLEYPYVYIVGMEEDLFPSQGVEYSREGLRRRKKIVLCSTYKGRETCNHVLCINTIPLG